MRSEPAAAGSLAMVLGAGGLMAMEYLRTYGAERMVKNGARDVGNLFTWSNVLNPLKALADAATLAGGKTANYWTLWVTPWIEAGISPAMAVLGVVTALVAIITGAQTQKKCAKIGGVEITAGVLVALSLAYAYYVAQLPPNPKLGWLERHRGKYAMVLAGIVAGIMLLVVGEEDPDACE